MRPYDIIQKKRNGAPLSPQEIAYMVQGYTRGDIPDYQMAAFAMAVWFRGMTDGETGELTLAMSRSGDMLDLSPLGPATVDKHSTGGVGDKTTLIVAPIAASLGAKVAKMSGRGLGHTGGTVDKLESFPGYRTALTPDELQAQVKAIGIAVAGQTADLAPADGKLYALRDVTATIDSLPLIASSIMSKKLAAGSRSIVLDVKCGAGAFMKTLPEAKALAESMVAIGKAAGRNMCALITDMEAPLGCCIGNIPEVQEAALTLRGAGPADLTEECVLLAGRMLSLSLGMTVEEGEAKARTALADGSAWDTFCRWIAAQGGEKRFAEHPEELPQAACIHPISAPCSGYITAMDAETVGRVSVLLGAGREKKGDPIDLTAGITLTKKPGDSVAIGETVAYLHTERRNVLSAAEETFLSALAFGDAAPQKRNPLLAEVR